MVAEERQDFVMGEALVSDNKGEGSQPKCQALLEALTDGVIGVDETARVIYLNSTAESLTGATLEEVRGQPIEEVFQLECTGARKSDHHDIRRLMRDADSTGTISNCHITGRDGRHIPIDYSISPLGPDQGGVILFHDLSHGQELRRRLLYQATHDALTGLPNRASIQQAVAWLHATACKEPVSAYTVLLMDLDHFKRVNDHHGHPVGDAVLAEAARRIAGSLRDQDSVGRWGGEEFLALLPETNREQGVGIAERVRVQMAASPIRVDQQDIPVSGSIGVAGCPLDGKELGVILGEADIALYGAKRAGRDRVCSADQVDHSPLSVAEQIQRALDERRVRPAFQEVFDLSTGMVVAREALARIVSDEQGTIEADNFVDAAMQLRLVHRIDHQIALETILSCGKPIGEARQLIPCFLNVSADLFRHPELVGEIAARVRREDVAICGEPDGYGSLIVELSEEELLRDVEETRRVLTPLLESGMKLGLEGFGDGGASLENLVDLPVAYMKLESRLVRRSMTNLRARVVLQGVVDTARALGIVTIAEKVEDQEVVDLLKDIGVDWGQGRLFSWPRFD